jgi:PEP-CTERM motif-containing protein
MTLNRDQAVAWIAAAALVALAPLAHANQVVNGGFESGDLTSWAQSGDSGFSGVDPFAAHSGSFGAFFGPEAPGRISQTFATTSGLAYKVDFWLALDDSSQPNSFFWSWNGVKQGSGLTNTTGFGYAEFSGLVSAIGSSSTLEFTFADPNSFWLLDDVSVNAVPEPETYALFASGLLALAAVARRRRRG